MQEISIEQVQQACTKDKQWLVIDCSVYDITKFAAFHPGGELIIREYAGKDATESFYAFHRQEVLQKYHSLKIAIIKGF
jgi:cytochrome b involved in lipid metabolism